MTGLACTPKPVAVEFRRCTGHCCDPVVLEVAPGELRARAGDVEDWVDWQAVELWRYLGWTPGRGHLYRCRALLPGGDCAVHGTGWKPRICRLHPQYELGPWTRCDNPACTRRALVVGGDYPLRWRYPDLWHVDKTMHNRTSLPEALAAPEAGLETWEL